MRRSLALTAAAMLICASVVCNASGQTSNGRRGRTTSAASPARPIDAQRLLRDVKTLSADSMEGRKADTPGSARARAYIIQRFKQSGLQPFGSSYLQPFTFSYQNDDVVHQGVNIIGYVKGSVHPNRYLVMTAHYDHLGVVNGQIYNGADDNASGVATLLALGAYFSNKRPTHSMMFAALDAEENSGAGGRKLVSAPPIEKKAMAMNVNLDMVSHNARNELYVAGTSHYPFLKPYLETIARRAPVRLLFGHDRPDLPPGQDWTEQSDHAAFHAAKIPFIYFGVEDHEDYHKPGDDFDRIRPDFFVRAAETILDAVKLLDSNLTTIRKQR